MSVPAPCSCFTKRGRPCRQPAVPGTWPPACARHRDATSDARPAAAPASPAAGQPFLPGLALPGDHASTRDRRPTASRVAEFSAPCPGALNAGNFYFPRPTAADLPVLAAGPDADLRPEVELVRVVLRRLVAHLDEAAGELSSEELRRVAALVFTGARTVALLAGKHAARATESEPLLLDALRHLGETYDRPL